MRSQTPWRKVLRIEVKFQYRNSTFRHRGYKKETTKEEGRKMVSQVRKWAPEGNDLFLYDK